ncbi:HAD family hydrolase [Streptomyces zagrosensis]|uniref:Putative hydrolase of the HAD superfamily n=1 Tax=Streptomyces zagrosensis TaxID=1042984 RepID=A0A7W9QF03_9ACTN|nr:HAD-IA family hydrolase [Streptomyces zagrosensis]MBB5938488.1 putative hydrolase of the HAD superfamily [Streptomyces zagrosensis]
MTAKGALFDFSGTLFRVEPAEDWLRAALKAVGIALAPADFTRYLRELVEVGAQPGGAAPRAILPHLAQGWRERDRTAEQHHAAYLAQARQVSLPHEKLYEALYARHKEPAAWRAYPDAAEVLAQLRQGGVRIAVVSNIGWDLRPIFREHGLDQFVDAYLLSFEHSIQKPEPALFRLACAALGTAAPDTVMVGDNRQADGGAAAIGCRVHFVDHVPVTQRPNGLRPVLGLIG